MINRVQMVLMLFGAYINGMTLDDIQDLAQSYNLSLPVMFSTAFDRLSNYSTLIIPNQSPGLIMPGINSPNLSILEHIGIGFIKSAFIYLCGPFNVIGCLICALITSAIIANDYHFKSINEHFWEKFIVNSLISIIASICPTIMIVMTCLGFVINGVLFIVVVFLEHWNIYDQASSWLCDSNSLWILLKRNLTCLAVMSAYLCIYVILSFILTNVGIFIANAFLIGLTNYFMIKAMENFAS